MHYRTCTVEKCNYLMTDDELRQWQCNAKMGCELDNIYNRMIENSLPIRDNVSEILEESAINMAIELHGIQPQFQLPRAVPANVQATSPARWADNVNDFLQHAISAAIETDGLGLPPIGDNTLSLNPYL